MESPALPLQRLDAAMCDQIDEFLRIHAKKLTNIGVGSEYHTLVGLRLLCFQVQERKLEPQFVQELEILRRLAEKSAQRTVAEQQVQQQKSAVDPFSIQCPVEVEKKEYYGPGEYGTIVDSCAKNCKFGEPMCPTHMAEQKRRGEERKKLDEASRQLDKKLARKKFMKNRAHRRDDRNLQYRDMNFVFRQVWDTLRSQRDRSKENDRAASNNDESEAEVSSDEPEVDNTPDGCTSGVERMDMSGDWRDKAAAVVKPKPKLRKAVVVSDVDTE